MLIETLHDALPWRSFLFSSQWGFLCTKDVRLETSVLAQRALTFTWTGYLPLRCLSAVCVYRGSRHITHIQVYTLGDAFMFSEKNLQLQTLLSTVTSSAFRELIGPVLNHTTDKLAALGNLSIISWDHGVCGESCFHLFDPVKFWHTHTHTAEMTVMTLPLQRHPV